MTESVVSLGLQMMCIGMGFVLCFLFILIVSMMIMSKVVGYLNKIFPEAVEEPKKQAKIFVISLLVLIYVSFK